ncbi:tyrosine-protein phosphatase [Actinomarinicola tropica]|uniref:Protein-tyrosine-phosphatase n=1 Tax=Actinomarinicola tropica TaxID=2789776 RepID=A0A5Q2RJ16_9ACTN|nr:tyrosine-protein phosphatase [Actinomarinicola tropica]QGG94882.1 protein-tyrosine-phosphatase [Actinomarinicola tropica]
MPRADDSRHIRLEGCLNLRDLGGYPTRDGGEVRTGCVYRSSDLCALTDGDVETVTSLGIAVVVDLRGHHERLARPNRLPHGVEVHERTSPSTRTDPARTLEDRIASRSFPDRDDDLLTASYLGHLEEHLTSELRTILELAVDSPRRPLVFHCAAGKDRTGIAAAVLLGVLGVGDDDIVADYELSTSHWAVPRLAALARHLDRHGVTADEVRHLVEPRTEVLRRVIDHVHGRWGGFESYAVECLGLRPSLPRRLRSALVAHTGG